MTITISTRSLRTPPGSLVFAAVCGASLTAASSATAQVCMQAETAEYELRFDATWTEETHPQDYPLFAHFSPLVGGAHSGSVAFWEAGGIASQGIESMAETGVTFNLENEVQAAINQGFAREIILGEGVGQPPASTSVNFTVSQDHPLATVVTMIAPSPDWFVGVNGVDLIDANGRWVDQVVIDLYPWDAGTDSGTMYNSPNQDTNPQEPIAEITGYPFLNNEDVLPLGTFTFTRIDGSCLDLCVDQLVANDISVFTVEGGEPGQTVAVVYGFQPGRFATRGAGWCVDFGIDLGGTPLLRLVAQGSFDANGQFQGSRLIPGNAKGVNILFQAAQRGTCPKACMSNILDATVQ